MQPIFEAFTNSLESIRLRANSEGPFNSYINISLNFNMTLDGKSAELYSIEIEDNGIGFDSENYSRLVTFKDDTKGFNNRGSGRIQLVHYFKYAHYKSTYKENGRCYEKSVVLSKEQPFISNNSLVYLDTAAEISSDSIIKTKLVLETPLASKDNYFYSNLSLSDIKKELINHYILSFCSTRKSLPDINLFYVISGNKEDSETIKEEDIPIPTQNDLSVSVPMYKISDDMKRAEPIKENEIAIHITPFKIKSDILDRSDIKITSKGEISETSKIKVTCLDPDADINGNRFLFLLSSKYFDNLEGDERGNIDLIDKTEFKKRAKENGSIENQILINDIQEIVNNKAAEIYSEIAEKKNEFNATIEKLKRDYLLSEEALEDISLGDSVEDVLKKAYNYDAKLMAHQNASYEERIKQLSSMDPTSDSYPESLSSIVDELVESIPIQNRATLSKYVARRRMVINLMEKILNRLIICQDTTKRNEDEKLLHNLIFKQHSENPLDSDLWLINEEYMYFKGVSETQLSKVKIDGKNLFRDGFSKEEERYLTSKKKKDTLHH